MKPVHLLLAVLVSAIWGFNFVVIDWGLGELPPLVLTALRFVAAALPLVFLLPRPTARWRFVIGYGLALGVAKFGVLFIAIDAGMPAGLASLLLQAQALLSVLLAAAVLRERPSGRQIAGVVVASAGIALLALVSVDGESVPLLAFGLTLFAAAAWAVANVVIKASKETRPLSMLAWSSLVPPLPLLGIATVVGGPQEVWRALSTISPLAWFAVFYIAYVSTLVGFGIWNSLIGRYGVATVAPFSLLVPIFGITATWLVLDQAMTVPEAVAAVVVMAGLVLVMTKSRGTVHRDDSPLVPVEPRSENPVVTRAPGRLPSSP